MKKILFIAMALIVGLSSCDGSKKKPVKKEMGLQLYSIRELIGNEENYAKNHVEVFKQLKEMGYTYVEAAHYNDGKFYGVSPEQYKQDCEEAGLKPLSSHATRGLNDEELANHDFTEALKWWEQAIAAHKAAGMEYIVTPGWGVPKNLQEAQTMCDYANEIGKMCREAGLKYGYHTHSHEYQKVEGQVWMEYFIENTDPENMFWQMDVYWACWGNQFPVHYFKKYPGRFKMLHIKDKYELGESGFVGFDAIFGAADIAGLENFIVEIEETDDTIDIMEACRRSAEYIQNNPAVKATYAK